MIVYDKHQGQIIFIALQKLIAITIAFHKSYQCGIMSEITLNISLYGSNCNKLLRQFYSIMIAYDKHQYTNHFPPIAITIVFQLIMPMFHYVRNYFKNNITWF